MRAQKVEATQVSIKGQRDKKKIWYVHTIDVTQPFLKRKEILTRYTWISLEDTMLSKTSQSQKDKYSMISLV